MSGYGNVYFMGVARKDASAIVVANYSYHSEIDIDGVKQVLNEPNLNLSAGKHYTFSANQVGWHLNSDDMGLIYILICQSSYPQRCAHAALEDLQRSFAAHADIATKAKERQLNTACQKQLIKLCQKYDNVAEVDKLAAVAGKVDAVRLVMRENIDVALQNCVKLEAIEMQAEELQQQAAVFERGTKTLKNKMWWKNMKMKLIIAFLILCVLSIIIGVAVGLSEKNKQTTSAPS